MKKVALLVVGLVFISMSSFAGEYLMNDTGEPIYGLRVVFSEPVEITGFGDVLMAVEPAGESSKFTFSGGELEPWAGHWFNWEPASASLINHGWLADPALVVNAEAVETDRSDVDLPLWMRNPNPTYEEIMAEIAEYPGPDEPLYESAPDEAIWLTDLEGHADIYDNDSIKINYADWFDKSHVTKIEVYRNGVKMRFLPDTFDVLTNEQMKTFDGNPLEHTPASSHTDHAIWGYEYQFRFQSGQSLAVRLKSPVRLSAEAFVHAGDELWLQPKISEEVALERLCELRELGYDGVQFNVEFFMNSEDTTEIFPQYTSDPNLLQWFHRTATPDEVRRLLRLINEAGMQAEMRIAVWLTLPYMTKHPHAGRHSIAPTSWESWFDNYREICVDMALIAEEGGCDIFSPFTEMAACMPHTAEIKSILDAVDSVYSGKICISQATCAYLDDLSPESSEADWAEYFRSTLGGFWEWDGENASLVCGVEWWPGFVGLDSQRDQRLAIMTSSFVAYNSIVFRYFANSYPDLEIRFDELGTFNYDGATIAGTFDYPQSNVTGQGTEDHLDNQEFADSWSAFLTGIAVFGVDTAVWSQWIESEASWYSAGLRFLDYTPAKRVVHEAL
jgi:hypothetical protein